MKPTILATEIVAKTRLFTVEKMHLRFSNGEERFYERILGGHRGAVMMLPLLDSQTLLLVREYAAGVDDYVLGFPKGAIEKDEDILLTANRELMEEIGYASNKLTHLRSLSPSPGYVDSTMHVIVAEDLYEKQLLGDEPEPLEVVPWQLSKLDALLEHSEFYEARSVAALCLLERYLSKHD